MPAIYFQITKFFYSFQYLRKAQIFFQGKGHVKNYSSRRYKKKDRAICPVFFRPYY